MPGNASSSSPGGPTSSLLLRLKDRQPEAWRDFLRLYGPLVYSWCRTRWRLGPADAADLMQEVSGRVLETIGDFRGGNFIAWLERVTRSRVANHFRKNPAPAAGGSDALHRLAEVPDPRGTLDPLADEPSAEEADPLESLGGVLLRAVEAVRAHCADLSWKAFWQVSVEGRRPADVAADLGLSANAVYVANSRILHRLRAELGPLEKGTGT